MKSAILAGCRTPFLRSGTGLAELTAREVGLAKLPPCSTGSMGRSRQATPLLSPTEQSLWSS